MEFASMEIWRFLIALNAPRIAFARLDLSEIPRPMVSAFHKIIAENVTKRAKNSDAVALTTLALRAKSLSRLAFQTHLSDASAKADFIEMKTMNALPRKSARLKSVWGRMKCSIADVLTLFVMMETS